jgi:hypothetical protein
VKLIDFPAPGGQTVTVNPDQVCQIFRDPSLSPAPALLDLGSGEPQGVTDDVPAAGKRLGIPLAELEAFSPAGTKIGTVLVAPAQVTFVREVEPGRPDAGSLVHLGNGRTRAVTQSRKDAVDRIMAAAAATKDADA